MNRFTAVGDAVLGVGEVHQCAGRLAVDQLEQCVGVGCEEVGGVVASVRIADAQCRG
ncbi:hypothetical protein [Streptomyces vinaceus]|uniref:hypothetical protein n=1 Tax=Streptomyces vinaceus TaxID=1960 RepID=UPI00142EB0B8|nr:hypothetical protein [Streptomyces vinaceus]